mgnify:CR=1 FL=1
MQPNVRGKLKDVHPQIQKFKKLHQMLSGVIVISALIQFD